MFNKTSPKEKISISKTLTNIPLHNKFNKQLYGACHVHASPSRQGRPRVSVPRCAMCAFPPGKEKTASQCTAVRFVRFPPEGEDRECGAPRALNGLKRRPASRFNAIRKVRPPSRKEDTASQCTEERFVRPPSRNRKPRASVPRRAQCAIPLEKRNRCVIPLEREDC
jgi:hypothetical protein